MTFTMQEIEQTARTQRADRALIALLDQLGRRGYRFVTPTPETHARVTARRACRDARNLRDVMGWSLPFEPGILDAELLGILHAADALVPAGKGRVKSLYRVSSVAGALLLHSAYPTDETDAVFLGPDSYRFADFLSTELAPCLWPTGSQLVDIGTGSGVGGIVAARLCPEMRITMTDINSQALRLARINAVAAGANADYVHCANMDGVEGPIAVAMANPPYIIDPAGRQYRDGGGLHGGSVSYAMTAASLDRLSPGGRFILYTGSAIIDGRDRLQKALLDLARQHGCSIRYRELDPDVFGEELDKPAYADVERIAIVGAVISRPD